MKLLDNLLNSFTMYKVVLYGLTGMAILSLLFSFLGLLSFSPLTQFITLVILLASCFSTNLIFSKLFKVPVNTESQFITAFILFFLFSPSGSMTQYLLVALAGILAMSSKYVLAIRRKHIFNPAAFGAFIVGFLGLGASWWIGSEVLFIPMLLLGVVIVRKLRRFHLFLSFMSASLVVLLTFGYFQNVSPLENLKFAFTSWPLLFLGTVMLTEPLTTPPTKRLQGIYGAIVGGITTFQLPILNFYITPEFALLVGNVFSYIVSPKYRLKLTLKEQVKLSGTTNSFIFTTPEKVKYKAGQYMEWTLPHAKQDVRGVRRFFTIASSPTEDTIQLGVKKYNPSSTFKNALFNMKPGDTLWAGSLTGDFILPEDKSKKLVFIAGGIGITPFRSMVKYLIDTNETRNVVLLHVVGSADELTYKELFKEGAKIGLKTVSWDSAMVGHMGYEKLKELIPDYMERDFYISGANAMVHTFKDMLTKIGIPRKKIKTDYFPGL